jgi:hypothetical protein
MSENLDLVRSICEDWRRGDFSHDAWAHPQIEFTTADLPAAGSSTGRVGMAESWREFLGMWENYSSEPLEYRQLDSERVLAVLRHRGRARTSGIDIERALSEAVALFHVHDGQVTRLTIYGQRENAFADLGLEG